MHQQQLSFFTYNISRPFPYRWFTPVAVVGGLLLAVGFTLLNFASVGYLLVVETSPDPNATVAANPLQPFPSYLTSKIQPVCQPITLPVGTQFFTNQTALTYTLTGVWQEGAGDNGPTVSPSLTYHQNPLQNCSVSTIQIDIESQDRAANQLSFTEWGAKVRTYTTCRISTVRGTVFFNLTQDYDYVPDTVSFAQDWPFLGSGFLSRDRKARASLWWGESLMSTYWAQMIYLLQNETREAGDKYYHIRKGSLSFIPRPEEVEITSPDFFRFNTRFIEPTKPGEYKWPRSANDKEEPLAELIKKASYPNIWSPADNLAKSVYSTVLTDLGQASSRPNLLADATTLQTFAAQLPSAQENVVPNAKPGPATQSYDQMKQFVGPLGVHPSVISAQYICQVPRRRSAFNLTMALLTADLVFLQAAWTLYTLVASWWLRRKDPASDCCSGCLGGMTANDAGRHSSNELLTPE
ncbi:hypothetical protein PG984_013053 [Apiospora sp. TS-2023a]